MGNKYAPLLKQKLVPSAPNAATDSKYVWASRAIPIPAAITSGYNSPNAFVTPAFANPVITDLGNDTYTVSPTLLSLLPAPISNAYVDTTVGSDANNGLSWATAKKTYSALAALGADTNHGYGVLTDYTNRGNLNSTLIGDKGALLSLSINAGGTGGTNGTQTLTINQNGNTTGTISATISGGALTAIGSITTAGHGYTPTVPGTPCTVTGAGLTGALIDIFTVDSRLYAPGAAVTGIQRTWSAGSGYYSNVAAAFKNVASVVDLSTPIGNSFRFYTKVFSIAAVQALTYSWFVDMATGTIYVNTNGVNPGTGTFSEFFAIIYSASTPTFLGNSRTWVNTSGTTFSNIFLVTGLEITGITVSGAALLQVASLATCNLTSASWYVDPTTATIYVNTGSTQPDSTYTFYHFSGIGVGTSSSGKTGNLTWVDNNVTYLSGCSWSSTSATQTFTYYSLNCRYLEAPGSNGFSIIGNFNVYMDTPYLSNNFNDGINFHGDTTHSDFGLAYSPRWLVVNSSTMNSGYPSGGNGVNYFDNLSNAETSHEYAVGISVGARGVNTKGGPFYFIWGTKTLMVGAVSNGSSSDDPNFNLDYVVAGNGNPEANAELWLYKCRSNGNSTYGLSAQTGGTIHVYGHLASNPVNLGIETGAIIDWKPYG